MEKIEGIELMEGWTNLIICLNGYVMVKDLGPLHYSTVQDRL